MPNYLEIQPDIIRWAIRRSGLPEEDLRNWKKGIVFLWENGEKKPTLSQLTDFAKKVHVPFGYLFLDTPPEEKIPVPDFRTFDDNRPRSFSPDLIDTLYDIQRRQNWMRDYLIEVGAEKLPFVGSLKKQHSVATAAEQIRQNLGLAIDWMFRYPTPDQTRRFLRNSVDDAGIMISISGVVGWNNRRPLDPDEFCGFTLLDDYVPALFVNNNIPKSSQMFTIAHELAHIWMGKEGVFNQVDYHPDIRNRKDEELCNKIAAEFLVPENLFRNKWMANRDDRTEFGDLAKTFKVSQIVVARRAFDLNLISNDEFYSFLHYIKQNFPETNDKKPTKKQGGNFYLNSRIKLGKRFSDAVISATRSGYLSYGDAFRLTGLNGATFDNYVSQLQGGKFD